MVKRAYAFVKDRPAVCIFVLAVVAAVFVAWEFPVYFRQDDVYYLQWASNHASPLAAFIPSEAILFGMFRPMQNLTWWVLYHSFGLEAYGYHIVVLLLYGISVVLFWKLVAILFSRRVAVLAVVAYFGVFFYLTYVVFWFSDLTYILELVFVNLSLYLLVSAAKGERSYFWGLLSYLFAVMSKEPSLLIVPAVTLLYLRSKWRDLSAVNRRRSTIAIGIMLGTTVAWVLLGSGLQRRQGIDLSSGLSGVLAFVSERWVFYSKYLLSEFRVLAWVLLLYLALRSILLHIGLKNRVSFYAAIVGSLFASFALRPFPAVALAVLLVFSLVILVQRNTVGAALAWFWLPLLGIMTVSYMIRTYLVEASFGMAILMGAALDDIVSGSAAELRRVPSRRVIRSLSGALGVFILVFGVFGFVPKVRVKLRDLSVVSNSRLNFRDAIGFLVDNATRPNQDLVIIDYEDMGLKYTEDVIPLGDTQKAGRQKTMSGAQAQELLSLAGMNNITVHNLQWLRQLDDPKGVLVLVMNDYEKGFADKMSPQKQAVFEKVRDGTRVWVYAVTN